MIVVGFQWFAEHGLAFALVHLLLTVVACFALWLGRVPGSMLRYARLIVVVLLLAPLLLLLIGPVTSPVAGRFMSIPASVVDAKPKSTPELAEGGVQNAEVGSTVAPVDWSGVMITIWLLGGLVGVARLGWDLFRLRRHLRRLPSLSEQDVAMIGSKLAAGSLCDASASGAYSVSFYKRLLVFPPNLVSELSHAQLRSIIRHEESHLRHRDSIDTLLWCLVRALYWWNPLAHLLVARVNELQEWRADEESVGEDQYRACEFSRLLIDQADSARQSMLVHPMKATSAKLLKRRLQRLLANGNASNVRAWVHAVTSAMIMLSITGSLAACSTMLGSRAKLKREHMIDSPMEDHIRAMDGFRISKELEERAAKVKNALDTDELVAIELKFFEMGQEVSWEKSTGPLKMWTPEEFEAYQKEAERDPEITQVAYPRVLTADQRAVVVRSVINEPVVTNHDPATNTTAMDFLPVGTSMVVFPVILASGKIHCELSVTLTSILGHRTVDGMSSPIVSTRVFSAPLVMKSGHFVRIDGLDESLSSSGESKLKPITVFVTATRIPKSEAGVGLADD